MTPCDPLGTQTLAVGVSVVSLLLHQGEERGVADPCLPGPGNGMHTGFLSSSGGGGTPSPAHGEGRRLQALRAGISVHASFQEQQQQQQENSGAILASLLQVRTADQFPGRKHVDFSPLLTALHQDCHVVLLCIRSASPVPASPITRMRTVILSPSPQPHTSFTCASALNGCCLFCL